MSHNAGNDGRYSMSFSSRWKLFDMTEDVKQKKFLIRRELFRTFSLMYNFERVWIKEEAAVTKFRQSYGEGIYSMQNFMK